MARLKTLAASFIVLFVAAAAAAYRTTITTVEVEEENPGKSQEQRCRQQIQRQQGLNSCQQYIRESSQTTRRETLSNQSGWIEEFPRCCDQLEQLDEQCRCEGIRRIVQQQRQQGELRGQEMEEMVEIAESLPSLCRLSPRRRCDAQSASWF